MSGYIVHLVEDGAIILTDGACCAYDEKRERYALIWVGQKVWPMPDISAALVFIGAVNVLSFACSRARHWKSFDKLCELLPADTQWAAQQAHASHPALGTDCEIGAVGWSESRERWEFNRVIVEGNNIFSAPPKLEVSEPDFPLYIQPPLSDEEIAAAVRNNEPGSVGILHDMMHKQRQSKHKARTRPELGDFYTIGGFIQQTTLTRNAIESRIVHRWPDKIGEPLDPLR